jgi:hypothetical protein
MQNVINIGKRLFPLEQIAFVEPFDPTRNPEFKSDKLFKARVVLLSRDTVLTESDPAEFAELHEFGMLSEDGIALNPAVDFQVETFTPTETFKPEKPFVTRLKWRDVVGNEHSKLLLSSAETLVAVALRGEGERRRKGKSLQRPTSTRPPKRSSRKLEAVRS